MSTHNVFCIFSSRNKKKILGGYPLLSAAMSFGWTVSVSYQCLHLTVKTLIGQTLEVLHINPYGIYHMYLDRQA